MKTKFVAALAMVFGLPAMAAAQQVGAVTELTGEVWVVRGEQTLNLTLGDAVFEGDRVLTTATGSATLDAFECPRELAALQSVVVSAGFCDASIVAVQQTAEGGLVDVVIADVGGAVTGGGVGAAPILGVLALGVIGAAAADDDDSPASP